jgi:hypothetical protein
MHFVADIIKIYLERYEIWEVLVRGIVPGHSNIFPPNIAGAKKMGGLAEILAKRPERAGAPKGGMNKTRGERRSEETQREKKSVP